jgi:large subunit ribosomal protein L24
MKLKKGDNVIIIAGKDKGKTGTVEAVLASIDRVVVNGVNSYKKHVKPSSQNPQGGVAELFRPLHISNVMLLDENQKPTRVSFKVEGTEKSRVARTTGKVVGK